ncbi:MAG: S46 family peptidase, partial [Bacteroidales bacterium]|nr:S46 family peptidase [Bacteroidales bacterium]
MKKILSFLFVIITVTATFADEGMWIPMLLGKNEADMQKQGMRITAKDIYDINNACLKDAVVLFGGGCTGEYVSSQGLLFTNHHCGYSQIAARSTLEHNYLANGFWAKSFDEEIPCPGLSVTRLVRMEDVTNQVLANVKDDMSEADRNALINENIKKIGDKAVEGTHYKAVIKPFYYGNQYFMYVNEVFTDVRLVGTPPSNIGKFGGDTDNWMWPRHTGDFSVFRVYADKDNKPAPYSADNQPYKPLKHLTISLKGAEQNDFTFVFGYPGTTQRYITSDAVELIANVTNPVRIALRTIRLDHYNNAMNQDAAQRLKYSSTVASIANGWKKWQGETIGVNRLEVPKMKREFEQKFQQWANDKAEYRDVLPQLAKTYSTLKPIELERTYFNEAVMASDFMKRAYAMWQLVQKLTDDEALKTQCESLVKSNEKYFADFERHTIVDKAIFIETFTYMWQKGYAKFLDKKCGSKADVEEFLDKTYEKSMLTHKDKVIDFLKGYTTKKRSKLLKDPAVDLFNVAYSYVYNKDKNDTYRTANQDISRLMRTYVKGMMEMQPDV